MKDRSNRVQTVRRDFEFQMLIAVNHHQGCVLTICHWLTSWTAPLWISRFNASHGFYTETVASAKTANKFGTAANIEAFDAKWRCPAKGRVVTVNDRKRVHFAVMWIVRVDQSHDGAAARFCKLLRRIRYLKSSLVPSGPMDRSCSYRSRRPRFMEN